MAELDDSERRKIKWILYDDMCHLGPFSQNPVVLNINKITRFFGTRNLAVDCLHFLNHKDKVLLIFLKLDFIQSKYSFQKCQSVFDPYVPELSPVNTVICEQSFAWSNQYSNVKSMNGPRFNHFFHYLLDLHNLKVILSLYLKFCNGSIERWREDCVKLRTLTLKKGWRFCWTKGG